MRCWLVRIVLIRRGRGCRGGGVLRCEYDLAVLIIVFCGLTCYLDDFCVDA